jgi:hypothetical protein
LSIPLDPSGLNRLFRSWRLRRQERGGATRRDRPDLADRAEALDTAYGAPCEAAGERLISTIWISRTNGALVAQSNRRNHCAHIAKRPVERFDHFAIASNRRDAESDPECIAVLHTVALLNDVDRAPIRAHSLLDVADFRSEIRETRFRGSGKLAQLTVRRSLIFGQFHLLRPNSITISRGENATIALNRRISRIYLSASAPSEPEEPDGFSAASRRMPSTSFDGGRLSRFCSPSTASGVGAAGIEPTTSPVWRERSAILRCAKSLFRANCYHQGRKSMMVAVASPRNHLYRTAISVISEAFRSGGKAYHIGDFAN